MQRLQSIERQCLLQRLLLGWRQGAVLSHHGYHKRQYVGLTGMQNSGAESEQTD